MMSEKEDLAKVIVLIEILKDLTRFKLHFPKSICRNIKFKIFFYKELLVNVKNTYRLTWNRWIAN
jgi:hypothetical protein